VILIVDDDQIFLERAKEILNQQRRVVFASNSQQAFQLAQDIGFSVVLVNLHLRSDDGLKLIGVIHEKVRGLPIIALNDPPHSAIVTVAKHLGAVEVLNKPIRPEWKPVVERVRATANRS